MASRRVQPEYFLDAIGLGRHNPRRTVRVVDLRADCVRFDQAADRHRAGWRVHRRVVRLTRGDLLRRGSADVEPDRRVEAEDLVDQRVLQLMLENLRVLLGREVAVLAARGAIRSDHPVHKLLEAPLALHRADRAAEVLCRHDVRRVDRPEVGELDAALLKVDRAIPPVRHHDISALPGDLVIGVNAFAGVDTAQRQALGALAAALRRWTACRLGHVLPLRGSRPTR